MRAAAIVLLLLPTGCAPRGDDAPVEDTAGARDTDVGVPSPADTEPTDSDGGTDVPVDTDPWPDLDSDDTGWPGCTPASTDTVDRVLDTAGWAAAALAGDPADPLACALACDALLPRLPCVPAPVDALCVGTGAAGDVRVACSVTWCAPCAR